MHQSLFSRRSRPRPSQRERRSRFLQLERLEDRRLLVHGGGGEPVDFGDAPDPGLGTGPANYRTTDADNGPSHTIVPGLYLGNRVDGDHGATQTPGADGDDHSSLLADLAGDFVAGTTAGQSVTPAAAGGGTWRYLTSDSLNPSDANANLQDMVWDTGNGFFESPDLGAHTDGFNGVILGGPSGGEITVHPRRFTPNTVARWTAGPQDAGEITIDGRVRKADISGGDGIRFLIYVDGVLEFTKTIAGTDGLGVDFTLEDHVVNIGSTVDFVIDANINDNFHDSTRLGATIAKADDEDGVDANLKDLHLFPGNTTELILDATNTTGVAATLAGWIDYNGDGVFDNATERATAPVPAGSNNAPVTLVFPAVPDDTVFSTYARFRLSSDAAFVSDPQPIGSATDGEVEDYLIGRYTRIWDGEAGDNSWFNPLNWATLHTDGTVTNSNVVPRSFENALIGDAFAGETILVSSSTDVRNEVRSIRSAAPLVITEKGRLRFSQDSQLAGLTLDGVGSGFNRVLDTEVSGGRKLVIDGDLVWNRDTIYNMAIQVNGNVTFATNQPKSLFAASLTAFGDNSLWTGGDIAGFGSAIFNRGTMRMDTNSDFPPANIAAFVNAAEATLIHEAPSDANDHKIMYTAFTNHGTVEVRSGKLEVGPGSRVTHSGTFLVAADAELVVTGQHTFNAGSRIDTQASSTLTFRGGGGAVIGGALDVAGPVQLIEGADVKFQHDVVISHLNLDGHGIQGPGTVTVSDEFLWTQGGIQDASTVISAGTAIIGDTVNDYLLGLNNGSRFINRGEATWQGARIAFQTNSTFRNEGTLTETTNAETGVNAGFMENAGTWTVMHPSNAALKERGIEFRNFGDLILIDSNLRFQRYLNNGGTLTLDQSSLQSLGRFELNGGTIAGEGNLIGNLTQTAGMISPGLSPGVLTVTGDLNATGGGLQIEISGPPTDASENDAAGVNYDRLVVTGDASVAALDVELLGDYMPALGDRYTVLTAATITGPTSDNADSAGMTVLPNATSLELEVTSLLNTPPQADAGGPYATRQDKNMQLDGTGSTDAEQAASTLVYEWDLRYDGSLFEIDAVGIQPDVSFPKTGIETVALRVTDDQGSSTIATTEVQVFNAKPCLQEASGYAFWDIARAEGICSDLGGDIVEPGAGVPYVLTVQNDIGGDSQIEVLDFEWRTLAVPSAFGNNAEGGEFQITTPAGEVSPGLLSAVADGRVLNAALEMNPTTGSNANEIEPRFDGQWVFSNLVLTSFQPEGGLFPTHGQPVKEVDTFTFRFEAVDLIVNGTENNGELRQASLDPSTLR